MMLRAHSLRNRFSTFSSLLSSSRLSSRLFSLSSISNQEEKEEKERIFQRGENIIKKEREYSLCGEVSVDSQSSDLDSSSSSPFIVEIPWAPSNNHFLGIFNPSLSQEYRASVTFLQNNIERTVAMKWGDLTFQFPPFNKEVANREKEEERKETKSKKNEKREGESLKEGTPFDGKMNPFSLALFCEEANSLSLQLQSDTFRFWDWAHSLDESGEGNVRVVTALDAARFFSNSNFSLSDLVFPPRVFPSHEMIKTVGGETISSIWDEVSPMELYSAHRALSKALQYVTPLPRGGGFLLRSREDSFYHDKYISSLSIQREEKRTFGEYLEIFYGGDAKNGKRDAGSLLKNFKNIKEKDKDVLRREEKESLKKEKGFKEFGKFLRKHRYAPSLLNYSLSPSYSLVEPVFSRLLSNWRMPRRIYRELVFDHLIRGNPHLYSTPVRVTSTPSEDQIEQEFLLSSSPSSLPPSSSSPSLPPKGTVYAIDDPETVVVDDAVILEDRDDGLWVSVYVSDVSSHLPKDSKLDQIARNRVQTVYLPQLVHMMIPTSLASTVFSLHSEKEENSVMVFSAKLNDEGEVVDYSISNSVLPGRLLRRITYDTVDHILAGVEENENEETKKMMTRLYEIALKRQKFREEKGGAKGFVLSKSLVRVTPSLTSIPSPFGERKKVKEEGKQEGEEKEKEKKKIKIEMMRDDGQLINSRLLVAELMILSSEISSLYAKNNSLPFFYRWQRQGVEQEEWDELPALIKDPSLALQYIMTWPRAEGSLSPLPHASLGFDSYSRVTSPARRYSDIINHRQLKAHITGEPLPYSTDELSVLLREIGIKEREIKNLEMKSNQYWILRYLRQQMRKLKNKFWVQLTVLSVTKNEFGEFEVKYFLDDFSFRGTLKTLLECTPGETIWFGVEEVVPHNNYVSLDVERYKRKPPPEWEKWRSSSLTYQSNYRSPLELFDF